MDVVCFRRTANIKLLININSRVRSRSSFTRAQHRHPAEFPLSTRTREAPPTQPTIPAHMDSSPPHSSTLLMICVYHGCQLYLYSIGMHFFSEHGTKASHMAIMWMLWDRVERGQIWCRTWVHSVAC